MAMKTAEEVAERIIAESRLAEWAGAYVEEFKQRIAQALTAFREEGVKEAIETFVVEAMENDPRLAHAKNKVRSEALEEAAKIADSNLRDECSPGYIATKIRALKNKA